MASRKKMPTGLLDPESEAIAEAYAAMPSVRRQARGLLSLEPQEDQGMAQSALEMALSFIPGVGQLLAGRDIERARRANDPAAAAMAATEFVPIGRIGKAFGKASEPVLKAADDADYRMSHRPMTELSGASKLHEAYKSFGEDIYGKNALQFFGAGDPRETAIPKMLARLRDNPDATVTIYRGVPKSAGDAISSGDWVTLDPNVAKEYGEKVLKKQVKAKDVTTWPDSLLEFGYYPAE
jgi:hypothetical protein